MILAPCYVPARIEGYQFKTTMGKAQQNGYRQALWQRKASLAWKWILRNRPDVATRIKRQARNDVELRLAQSEKVEVT